MLRVEAIFMFRDETAMLDFARELRVEIGIIHCEYHYDPTHAVIMRGAVFAEDITRFLSLAAISAGVSHASAQMETCMPQSADTAGVT